MAFPKIQTIETTENQKLFTHPARPVANSKLNQSTEICILRANAAKRPPPRTKRPVRQNQDQQRVSQTNTTESV